MLLLLLIYNMVAEWLRWWKIFGFWFSIMKGNGYIRAFFLGWGKNRKMQLLKIYYSEILGPGFVMIQFSGFGLLTQPNYFCVKTGATINSKEVAENVTVYWKPLEEKLNMKNNLLVRISRFVTATEKIVHLHSIYNVFGSSGIWA